MGLTMQEHHTIVRELDSRLHVFRKKERSEILNTFIQVMVNPVAFTEPIPLTLGLNVDPAAIPARVHGDSDKSGRSNSPQAGLDRHGGARTPPSSPGHFSRALTEGNTVRLKWSTASQINSHEFTV
jgi:hypothetical protein